MTQTTFSDFYPSVSVVGAKGSTTAPSDGLSAKSLLVISDRQNITYNSAGVITPSTQDIALSVQKQNTIITPVWTIKDIDGTLLDANLLSGGTLYTNLIIQSQNVGWDNQIGTITVSSNTTLAPDNTMTADTVSDTDATQPSYVVNGLRYPGGPGGHTILAGENYYCSAFLLKTTSALTFPAIRVGVDGGNAWCFIDTNTGQVSSGVTVVDCGSYWYVQFISVSGAIGGPSQSFNLYPAYGLVSNFGVANNAATGFCTIWGAQVIKDTGHCSYIETSTAIRSGLLSNTAILTAPNFDTLRGSTNGIICSGTLVDEGGLISDKISIVKVQDGTNGTTGATGDFSDLKFIRSASTPSTPTGSTPSGWSDGVPVGNDTLWMSRSTKNSSGSLLGVWSTPQAISGLSFLGAYDATKIYYNTNSVTYNGGTYIATMTTTAGQAPTGTAQANTQWDVIAAPGPAGTPATPPSSFGTSGTPQAISIGSGSGLVNLRTLADTYGYTGLGDAYVTFTVTGSQTGAPGSRTIDTGTWPSGSHTIVLNLVINSGVVVWGGGGGGGSGGDYGPGAVGGIGGDAIYCQESITITNSGTIRGGSGGGGGGNYVSWYNSGDLAWEGYGGGGGGGGAPNGIAGTGGSSDAGFGSDGTVGTTGGGGTGGAGSGHGSGTGGAGGGASASVGSASSSGRAGGAAGYAVRKNGKTVTATGGTIQGSVA